MTMQAKTATDVDGYWTTLYHGGAALDIETPDAKAYIATCDNNGETETLTLHGIGTTIPQATGVIVVAENSEEIQLKVNYESAETAPSANSLRGVDNQTPTAEAMAGENDGCKPFVLSYKEATGLGFYEYTGDNLPATQGLRPSAPAATPHACCGKSTARRQTASVAWLIRKTTARTGSRSTDAGSLANRPDTACTCAMAERRLCNETDIHDAPRKDGQHTAAELSARR